MGWAPKARGKRCPWVEEQGVERRGVASPPWEVAGGLQAGEAMQKALCGEASSVVSSQHLTKVRVD